MKRGTLLKVLNAALGVLMLNLAATGFLHEHLPEETFEHLHTAGGILLVAGVVIHLTLNWKWVSASYFKRK